MKTTSVLIVEDELIIAKNTAKKLTKSGYNVVKIVSSGQAAISFFEENSSDLILMDIALKGTLDGIETAAKIKERNDIPIIFLTAYASEQTLDRAAEIGCYGYLIKPFREKELLATIKMALAKHQENLLINQSLRDTVQQYSSQLDDIYVNHLTNLPSRLFLRDSFEYLKADLTAKTPNINSHKTEQLIAVYNVSLDRLAKISNLLTPEQEKYLIKEISQRINNYASSLENQGITIYLANDNYVVMIPVNTKVEAKNHGHKIINLCNDVCHVDAQEVFLKTSIGMAFYPDDSSDIEKLLEQTKKAVNYVRSQGGNRCQAFSFALDVKDVRHINNLSIEADLHHALEKQELEIYYQPIINFQENTIVATEALLRWNHPSMGRIEPSSFIPIAEESGLIRPIGEWVLLKVCQQTQDWHSKGFDWLKISVNLSGIQFKQSDLFHKINQVLLKTSLSAQYLELEVTETILIDNIKANIQKLNLLKKLGVRIALDDFGTGYSSLSYLQKFPFDTLKIDSCFVRNLNKDNKNKIITKSTIQMAHDLGLNVVAEGVETLAELKALHDFNCDCIQGFLISRPLSGKDFLDLLKNFKGITY